jgi:uncharacterized membrane protein
MSVTASLAVRAGGPEHPLRARREPALLLAALLWTGGMIHAEAAAAHWTEWPLAAAFFVLVSLAQFGLGAMLWSRPSPRLLLLIAIGSLLLAALWLVTRTVGAPFSPDGAAPESIGAPDVAATLDELTLVGLTLVCLRRGEDGLPSRWVLQGMLIVLLFAAMATGGHVH